MSPRISAISMTRRLGTSWGSDNCEQGITEIPVSYYPFEDECFASKRFHTGPNHVSGCTLTIRIGNSAKKCFHDKKNKFHKSWMYVLHFRFIEQNIEINEIQ